MNNFDFHVVRFATNEEINTWLNEIERIVKKKLSKIGILWPKGLRLYDYHKVVDADLHGQLWPKKERIFSEQFLKSEMINDWLRRIKKLANKREILDIEGIGYPEIYFRLVRPNESEDISGIHTDGAFYSITNKLSESKWERWLKVWVPLYFEPEHNTLAFARGSNKEKYRFDIKNDLDKKRPLFAKINHEKSLNWVKPINEIGEIVLFSPRTLHCAYNKSSNLTRISFEFAIG